MFASDIAEKLCANTCLLSRADINAEELASLAAIINDTYTDGERGICLADMQRTSAQSLSHMIEKGELIGLLINSSLKSCIHVETSPYEKDSGLFGMLVVAKEDRFRGKGYGTFLVDTAEKWALDQGFSSMNLKLLKPLHYARAHKNRLEAWYEKRGYVYQYSTAFMHTELLMIDEYDFKIYKKALANS